MKSGKKHKLLVAAVVAALFLTMMFPASVFARNDAADGNGGKRRQCRQYQQYGCQ